MSVAHRAQAILDIGSKVLVTIAAGALLWTMYRPQAPAPDSRAIPPPVEDVSGLRIDGNKATKRVGDASVVLVEFTDFECPFCARHARETYPSIWRELIAQKKLTYVSFAFPLEGIHRHARKASEAAECAARQGRYWEMHEQLFANRAALEEPDVFVKTANAIGLDNTRFETCMATEAAQAVADDIAEGTRLGVNSTPTFFIGKIQHGGAIELRKRINGAAPLAVIAGAVEAVTKG